jgi:phosphoglycolate phosphatase-like HAD superfamily hydrolase/ADP-ribose pyrophosphatase YjhB (NUDIX family)
MIRNIIFDWSGTLVDDLPAVLIATNYVFAQAQVAEISLDRFRAEFCLPFKSFYEHYVPHVAQEQLETWFHSSFKNAQDSVVALPHAREFLEFCRAHSIRTFLLSTVHEAHYKIQADATGLGQFIDRPYLGVWDKRKMIHQILAENNLRPEETMFIGDMQHDIDTAKHGGINSCAVLTGYNKLTQLRASHPDVIVEHLGELQDILAKNNFRLHPEASAPAPIPIVTVGALIHNAANQMLLVRTHKWSDLWGIPGGKIKWGEESIAALRREIMEETNLTISDIRFVLAQDCIHSKEFYRDAHFVLLNYTACCVGEPNVKLNDEAREFAWLSYAEALAKPINQPTRILLEACAPK